MMRATMESSFNDSQRKPATVMVETSPGVPEIEELEVALFDALAAGGEHVRGPFKG